MAKDIQEWVVDLISFIFEKITTTEKHVFTIGVYANHIDKFIILHFYKRKSFFWYVRTFVAVVSHFIDPIRSSWCHMY
jgi:hypothetical protein